MANPLLKLFHESWNKVPTVWIDTETTGVNPATDRCVQVGIVRFEGGIPVERFHSYVNPGFSIPAAAIEVHGITDEMVKDSPTIAEVFAMTAVQELLRSAQPAAYNAPFDRHFVPPFGEDWTWPWLDALSLVRVVDRFVSGKGRHKLHAAAVRHGVQLENAHDAVDDAIAAGSLFYKLGATELKSLTLGEVLKHQRYNEAEEWFRFTEWLSRQPSREAVANG